MFHSSVWPHPPWIKAASQCLRINHHHYIIDGSSRWWIRSQGCLGSGLRCGTDGLGQYKTHGIGASVRDGLWRPGGAFLQIGLGCVMSHHQSLHRRALHIPVLILAGKFKMEILPTVSHWKGFPVAHICPNSHKIVSSCIRAFLVAQICQNLHKFVFSCMN